MTDRACRWVTAQVGRHGRTVAEVLAVERKIEAVEPHLAMHGGNWEIEFFDSDRYNAARNRRAPQGYDT